MKITQVNTGMHRKQMKNLHENVMKHANSKHNMKFPEKGTSSVTKWSDGHKAFPKTIKKLIKIEHIIFLPRSGSYISSVTAINAEEKFSVKIIWKATSLMRHIDIIHKSMKILTLQIHQEIHNDQQAQVLQF